MGRPLAERLGYPTEVLDAIPPASLASFAGVGYYLDLLGDVSGHQVRIFEIHRTYPAKEAPVINGQKIVESWSRGFSDYTSNNGEGTTYAVYVLENGDKFFTKGSLVALQKPESPYLSAWVVGPILGGTGAPARINGMSRVTGTANPQAGTNEMQVDLEYWIPE